MPDLADPVLETLFLPFLDGQLHWPEDGVLFLRARDGGVLQARAWLGLRCEQSFKPDALALERAGFTVIPETDSSRYGMVLMLPPRQRDEARALMARALSRLEPGGRIVACASNNAGARSSEADLERLADSVETRSKSKCRVFWTAPLASFNTQLAEEWRALDEIRPVADGRFLSRPGVFAWDRIDAASALLAEHLPEDLTGRAADLGAGFGYLSAELASRCPRIDAIDVYEAENRALDLARRNIERYAPGTSLRFFWHDVTTGLLDTYDVIVTNPPFHTQSRHDRPDIGKRFIAVAAAALKPGGRLWLVANRHLPYETVLNDSFGTVRTVAQQHGFKIIEAVSAKKRGL